MRPSTIVPVLLWLAGCAPAPPPAAPANAPPPEAPAAPGGSATASWQQLHPQSIRCGADDQPRNVLDKQSEAQQTAGERGAKKMYNPEYIPEPVPRVLVSRQPPSSPSGSPLPPDVVQALLESDPDYESCTPQLDRDPPASFAFDIELSPGGQPLRVEPAESEVSPYLHCVMERACQLATSAALPHTRRLRVPLKVLAYASADEQMKADQLKVEIGEKLDGFQLQLTSSATQLARRCGRVQGKVRVEFSGRFRERTGARGATLVLAQLSARPTEGKLPDEIFECLSASLKSKSFRDPASQPGRTERFIITWNP